MRIGCLQFAPQVADVDNNLNRADAVLSRAQQEELDGLDLLVVPELAFTGYNFSSLEHITPFLEFKGSGISSLWARTIALKHNCVVVVGYPEKVDVSANWPASPEYYNSAIVINNEGETIGNYRKHFLYMIDETWALEGKGFGKDFIPGLGQTAMGICMDINPYKFESPWYAFEFAFHVLEVRANMVIISMAWLTREDPQTFSQFPQQPDMETLTYWVQRLEPLIRAESEEEIIVVFCNRTGTEDDVVYAGTSAVIGIKEGEVNVYGILGRGEKSLLIVDTENSPIGKLINRPDDEEEEALNGQKMISAITGVNPFSDLGSILNQGNTAQGPTETMANGHTSSNNPGTTLATSLEETRILPVKASFRHIPQPPSEMTPASTTSSGTPFIPSAQSTKSTNSPNQTTGSSTRGKLPPIRTSFGQIGTTSKSRRERPSAIETPTSSRLARSKQSFKDTAPDDPRSAPSQMSYEASRPFLDTPVTSAVRLNAPAVDTAPALSRGRQPDLDYASKQTSGQRDTAASTSIARRLPRAQSADNFRYPEQRARRKRSDAALAQAPSPELYSIDQAMSWNERPRSPKSRNTSRSDMRRRPRFAQDDNLDEIQIRLCPTVQDEPRMEQQAVAPLQQRQERTYSPDFSVEQPNPPFTRSHERSRSTSSMQPRHGHIRSPSNPTQGAMPGRNANMGLGFRTLSHRPDLSLDTMSIAPKVGPPQNRPRDSSRGRPQTKESPVADNPIPKKLERSRSASNTSPNYGHMRSWRASIQNALGMKHSTGAVTRSSPLNPSPSQAFATGVSPSAASGPPTKSILVERGVSRGRPGALAGHRRAYSKDEKSVAFVDPKPSQSATSPRSGKSDGIGAFMRSVSRQGRGTTPVSPQNVDDRVHEVPLPTGPQGGNFSRTSEVASTTIVVNQDSVISGPVNLVSLGNLRQEEQNMI